MDTSSKSAASERHSPPEVPEFNLWEGVYTSFQEAPVVGPGFAGEKWRQASIELARETLAREECGGLIDFSLRQRNAVLPAVISIIQSYRNEIRILDVGGGVGTGYAFLRSALAREIDGVRYDILEIPEICEIGEALFAGRSGPRFLSEFPKQGAAKYDVVYLASSLQYIEDWQGCLKMSSRVGAECLLLSDVLTTHRESFVTLQNYYGSTIASWFINESQLLDCLAELGYTRVLKLPCTPQIMGKIGPLPMTNFPAEYRTPHTWHLLFRKVPTSS